MNKERLPKKRCDILVLGAMLGFLVVFFPAYGDAHNSESLDQTNFWFRDVDGGEPCDPVPTCTTTAGATGFGAGDTAADTNITGVSATAQVRLRTVVDDTTSAQTNNQDYELQFSTDATTCTNGTWTTLTTTSSAWKLFDDDDITDQEATTNLIGSGLGTFVAGSVQDTSQVSVKISFSDGTNQFTEVEWAFDGNSPASDTTYRFRTVKSGGTALQAYSACPQLTTATAPVVSITALDGAIAYGNVAVNASQHTLLSGVNDQQDIVNTGNVTVNFDIQGTDSGDWTLENAVGSEQYMHDYSTDTGVIFVPMQQAAFQEFATGIAANNTQTLDLRLRTPSSTVNFGAQNVNITVQALEP